MNNLNSDAIHFFLPTEKVKIFSYVDGETMGSHEKFLEKLFKRGAKEGKSAGESDAVIVFVPIVSRFETDINSALSNISGKHTTIYEKFFVCFGIFSARYNSCFLFVSKKLKRWSWWPCITPMTQTTLCHITETWTINLLLTVCFMRRKDFCHVLATKRQGRWSAKR